MATQLRLFVGNILYVPRYMNLYCTCKSTPCLFMLVQVANDAHKINFIEHMLDVFKTLIIIL